MTWLRGKGVLSGWRDRAASCSGAHRLGKAKVIVRALGRPDAWAARGEANRVTERSRARHGNPPLAENPKESQVGPEPAPIWKMSVYDSERGSRHRRSVGGELQQSFGSKGFDAG